MLNLKVGFRNISFIGIFSLFFVIGLVVNKEKRQFISYKRVITYQLNKGRFGNNILNYAKAKYLSYKFNIPLIYVPFMHSEQLMIDEIEPRYYISNNRKKVHVYNIADIEQYTDIPTVYIGHFDSNIPFAHDKKFIQELRNLIKPKKEVAIAIPPNCISVAVHVRKGGGYDPRLFENERIPQWIRTLMLSYLPASIISRLSVERLYPLKFPSDSFYIDQLNTLGNLFKNQRLYVYIFTDDMDPQSIISKYRKQLHNHDFIFDFCVDKLNGKFRFKDHTITDFFAMMQFDCVIRSRSAFSEAAVLLGDVKIDIFPTHGRWIDKETYIIEKVTTDIKDQEWLSQKINNAVVI